MGLNTAASISFSQINSTSYFTNGNLGINTTNPTANLDVAGTIKASGLSSLASITTGALSATNVVGNSISAGTLSATTITGANLSLSGNLSVAGTLTTVNITSTNMLNTNISAGTINATGLSSLQNVTLTNVSAGIVIASTGITTGTISVSGLSTLTNVTATNVSTGVVIASTGVTTGTISVSGLSTLTNVTATNVSTGVVIASTGVTTGTISVSGLSTLTNVIATNVSTGVVIASTGVTTGTINASGLSALANVTATNVSAGIVIASTGITTGTISVSGLSALANVTATNVSTGGLNASGLSSLQNVTLTNISAATIQVSGTNDTQYVPSCVFSNNSTVGGAAVASFLTPNMPTPSISYSYFGKSLSSGDSASIAYNYVGSNNAANYIALNNYGKAGGIYLLNNGNVGIGTDSPLSSLHVSGTMPVAPSGNGVFMGIDVSNNYGIQLNSGTNGSANAEYIDFGYNGIDYVSRILSANADRSLSFYVNSNALASMAIQSTGNVSIPTLTSTSVTSGLLSATNVVGNSISAGTLSATTITGANLSLSGDLIIAGTLTTVNITSTNILNTNISAGTINATGTSTLQNVTLTNASASNLRIAGNTVMTPPSSSDHMGISWVRSSNNTDWYMYNPTGSDQLRIYNGSDRMTLAPSGNVGIGTNSPSYKLDVAGDIRTQSAYLSYNEYFDSLGIYSAGFSYGTSIQSRNAANTSNKVLALNPDGGNVGIGTTSPAVPLTFSDTVGDKISLYSSNTTANFGFGIQASLLQIHGGTIGDDIAFGYGASSYFTERMRITGTGNVGIGTTSPSGMLHLNNAALFTSTGNLTCTGDVVSFGSLSDRRLKKNIETIETAKALDIVSKLRAVSFDWKEDIFNKEKRNTSDLGFIAQEVEELIPEAVSEYTQIESGEVYKNIKHERLVPYLLSAIQYLLSKQT